MPSLNIYLPDDVYNHIASKGKAATIAAEWIKERATSEICTTCGKEAKTFKDI